MALTINTYGAVTPKKVSSKIKKVTVFINGAQVYRRAKVYLKPGSNKIIIDDVSPHLNPKSIQASCNNSGLILDVKHNIEYFQPEFIVAEPLPERIQLKIAALEDSLFYNQLRGTKLRNKIKNFETEKHIIVNNKTIKGQGDDSLSLFMDAVEFYQDKLEQIENWLYDLKVSQHLLAKSRDKIEADLEELRNYNAHKNGPVVIKKDKSHQIMLTIDSKVTTEAYVKVNYLVDRAGWRPSYDIRAEGANKPVDLTYKASIYQKTGEDWNNVDLTLSTFHQECSFSVPSLPTWEIKNKLDYNRSQAVLGYQSMNHDTVMMLNNGYSNIHFNTLSNTAAPTFAATSTGISFNGTNDQFNIPAAMVSNTDKTLSNVEFDIDRNYEIPADGKEVLLVIDNIELNSNFSYIAIPKINTDPFLLTNITDWADLNLLPAKANIYFDQAYVGETVIQPETIKDTLTIAVGRERSIYTTRKKIEDEEKEKLVGKNLTREISIELVVKNTMSRSANFRLKDQIPISKSDEIKIKVLDDVGARIDDKTGLLTWDLALKPKESRIIKFTYEITHDKDIEVI